MTASLGVTSHVGSDVTHSHNGASFSPNLCHAHKHTIHEVCFDSY